MLSKCRLTRSGDRLIEIIGTNAGHANYDAYCYVECGHGYGL